MKLIATVGGTVSILSFKKAISLFGRELTNSDNFYQTNVPLINYEVSAASFDDPIAVDEVVINTYSVRIDSKNRKQLRKHFIENYASDKIQVVVSEDPTITAPLTPFFSTKESGSFLETINSAVESLVVNFTSGDYYLFPIGDRRMVLCSNESFKTVFVLDPKEANPLQAVGVSVARHYNNYAIIEIEKGKFIEELKMEHDLGFKTVINHSFNSEPWAVKELRKNYPNLINAPMPNKDDSVFYGSNNWADFVENATGFKTKNIIKTLLSKLIKKARSDDYSFDVTDLMKMMNEDKRIITSHITQTKLKNAIDFELIEKLRIGKKAKLNIGQIQNLIDSHVGNEITTMHRTYRNPDKAAELLGSDKMYKLLIDSAYNHSTLDDCFNIVNELSMYASGPNPAYDLNRIKELSCSRLKTFHDLLVAEQNYIEAKIDSIPIGYVGFKNVLPKIKLEGYETVLPNASSDLIEIGQQLNNCIGTYKKRVISGQDCVVAFKKDDKYVMAMNVYVQEPKKPAVPGEFRIVEFRENYNKTVQNEIWEAVKKQLHRLFLEYQQQIIGQ